MQPLSSPLPVTSVVAKITMVPWEMKLIAMVTNEGCIILRHSFESLDFNMGRCPILFYLFSSLATCGTLLVTTSISCLRRVTYIDRSFFFYCRYVLTVNVVQFLGMFIMTLFSRPENRTQAVHETSGIFPQPP